MEKEYKDKLDDHGTKLRHKMIKQTSDIKIQVDDFKKQTKINFENLSTTNEELK